MTVLCSSLVGWSIAAVAGKVDSVVAKTVLPRMIGCFAAAAAAAAALALGGLAAELALGGLAAGADLAARSCSSWRECHCNCYCC